MRSLINWLRVNYGVITAAGAVAVSVGALYFAWEQARLMRTEQEIAVWPALQVDAFSDRAGGELRVGFRVENAGVGPAFVRTVAVRRSADEYIESYAEIQSLMPDGSDLSNSTMTGRILAAGAVVDPILIHWPQSTVTEELISEVLEEGGDWRFDICYCSAFGRCWTTHSGRVEPPEEVRDCAPAPEGRF